MRKAGDDIGGKIRMNFKKTVFIDNMTITSFIS